MNHSTLLGELQIEFSFWDNWGQLSVMKKRLLGGVGNCKTIHLGRTNAGQELCVHPKSWASLKEPNRCPGKEERICLLTNSWVNNYCKQFIKTEEPQDLKMIPNPPGNMKWGLWVKWSQGFKRDSNIYYNIYGNGADEVTCRSYFIWVEGTSCKVMKRINTKG